MPKFCDTQTSSSSFSIITRSEMSMSQDNQEDVNKLRLKEERKERKLHKKIAKKEAEQKEKEAQLLLLKTNKDSRVRTITQADFIKASSSANNNRKSAVKISLLDVIKKAEHKVPNVPKPLAKQEPYSGNILDSSQPERKRGKHRLKPKNKKSKLKLAIKKDTEANINSTSAGEGIEVFRYYDHAVSEDLDNTVKSFLSDIVRFQERQYQKDPLKGVAKRRYIVGFRQVPRFIPIGKLKLIVISRNLPILTEDDLLYKTVHHIMTLAAAYKTPYVFALTKRELGKVMLKHLPTSCVAILHHEGAEETYKEILHKTNLARETGTCQAVEDEVVKELMANMVHALKC